MCMGACEHLVQMYYSKVGKSKYKRERLREGHRVFGMKDDTADIALGYTQRTKK